MSDLRITAGPRWTPSTLGDLCRLGCAVDVEDGARIVRCLSGPRREHIARWLREQGFEVVPAESTIGRGETGPSGVEVAARTGALRRIV